MMATQNWSPHSDKLSEDSPGHENFVVFRKGGDGSILQARQVDQINLIGESGQFGYLPLK